MGRRRRARELVLQTLYALEFPGQYASEAVDHTHARAVEPAHTDQELAQLPKGGDEELTFHDRVIRGVLDNREEIDAILSESSNNWKVHRMAFIDRNILRMAVFELRWMDEIPPRVTMNEAIEIAKRYGTPESSSFVNGILDRVAALQAAAKS